MRWPLWRRQQDEELREELERHLRMATEDRIASGETPDEAARNARREVGNLSVVRELTRETWGWRPLEELAQDLRFACRMIRRAPGFTVVSVAILALGIGANTVMFSVVNTLLLRPLPYPESHQLLLIRTVDVASRRGFATSPPDFYEYQRRATTFSHLEAFYARPFNLTGGANPERVSTLIVSAGFFDALRTPPSLGRGFTTGDEQWGAHRVAVLTDGLWRRRFGRDPRVLGQSMTVNTELYVVVGVLPPGFSFIGLDAQLFVPMAFAPGDNMNSHSNYFLRLVGRLRPDVSFAQATGELNRLCDEVIEAHPENRGTAIVAESLQESLIKDVRPIVLVLLGAVGCLLLIACANLANLLLARAGARRREIAVRLAIGAARARLLRQFLTESLLLAMLGGAAGLLIAYLSIDFLSLLSQRVLPRAEDVRLDRIVLLFTCGVAALTGVLFGLAPSLHSTAPDLHAALKDGAGAGDSRERRRLRAGLVIVEVALSLILLAAAGLMMKSVYRLLHVDAGFEPHGVLTLQINLPREQYVDLDLERRFLPSAYVRSTRFFVETVERVRGIPGVRAVGASNGLPLLGEVWGKYITFYDRPLPKDLRGLSSIQNRVLAVDYFPAHGISVTSGRQFADRDTAQAPKVAIVNRELVRRYWNDRDPVGNVISVNPPLQLVPAAAIEEARRNGPLPPEPDKLTVIGVVADARYGTLQSAALPLVYVPFAQGSEGTTNMFLVVRTDEDPLALVPAIRDQIRQMDADQPLANIQTMEERVSTSVAQPRLQTIVLGAFAALAVLLAAVGLYGVMSYAVTQRTREIGIRMALGATRRDVRRLFLREAFAIVAIGVALGMVGAALTMRVLRTLLFGVSTADPLVFLTIELVLLVTAWLASYVPARRATRVDPLLTLRYE